MLDHIALAMKENCKYNTSINCSVGTFYYKAIVYTESILLFSEENLPNKIHLLCLSWMLKITVVNKEWLIPKLCLLLPDSLIIDTWL